MKERRKAGATHSFRLTRTAADLVDNMNHPRRLGGKSRKVSDAIVAYYGTPFGGAGMPSYDELVQNVAALQAMIERGHDVQSSPVALGWGRRVINALKRLFHI